MVSTLKYDVKYTAGLYKETLSIISHRLWMIFAFILYT